MSKGRSNYIVRPKKKSSHCQLETVLVNRKTLRVSYDQSIKTEYPRFRVLLFCNKKREALLLGSSHFAGPVFLVQEKQYAFKKKWQHEINTGLTNQCINITQLEVSILSTLSYFAFLSFAFTWHDFLTTGLAFQTVLMFIMLVHLAQLLIYDIADLERMNCVFLSYRNVCLTNMIFINSKKKVHLLYKLPIDSN